MVAYATIDDVTKRFRPIESSIGSGEFDVASVDVASIYIVDAEALIDAALRTRYIVPFTTVDPLITHIASDLAICNIMRDKLPETPEWIESRCQRAMDWLEKIQDGKLDLSSDAVVVTVNTGDTEAWSSTQDYHTVFNPVLDPLCQTVDDDRVESANDEREDDAGSCCGKCGVYGSCGC